MSWIDGNNDLLRIPVFLNFLSAWISLLKMGGVWSPFTFYRSP